MAKPVPGLGYDVMVSHDKSDATAVNKLVDYLSKSSLKVWKATNPGPDNGQAVVNCKVFVQVLSETAANSNSCQDELSLAYVSNKPIFPVGLSEFGKVAMHLDAGRKLMLAKINWTFLRNEEDYSTNLPELVGCIREKLAQEPVEKTDASPGEDEVLDELYFTMNDKTENIMDKIRRRSIAEAEGSKVVQDFWDQHFQGTSVAWTDFQSQFLNEYKDVIVDEFGAGKEDWLIGIIHRDIFSRTQQLNRDAYARFCGPNLNNDPDLFFNRVKDYAINISAMKEVFDMDSTVRLTAVQQLGAYRTQAVLAVLLDLIHDDDPNMRVVAALALGRSGRATKRVVDELLESLNDDDRLVRESVCLSLGHLKATRAVEAILDRWRNDPIRNVRDAANIALGKIGGEEADKAMKVTKVLSDEMANLRTKKR